MIGAWLWLAGGMFTIGFAEKIQEKRPDFWKTILLLIYWPIVIGGLFAMILKDKIKDGEL